MDRFEWGDDSFLPGEKQVLQQRGVALYDGHEKTSFQDGILVLSTHKLIWKDVTDRSRILVLHLSLVVFLEEQPSGFAKSAKIVVHLNAVPSQKKPGPVSHSANHFIRLSFRDAGEREFNQAFSEQLQKRLWEQSLPTATPGPQGGRHRAGIMGIERSLKQKQKDTDKDISKAFEDLSKLMEKAKEMVNLSKTIAAKIKDRQGEISEDETVKFKSYLLSMGIPDPVTRETHGTGDKYYSELAKQLSKVLEKQLQECGGIMTLTDVYCRVNRARGMELLSPEDMLHACELLESLRLPVRMKMFDSGVIVLQLQSHDEERVISDTTDLVKEKTSLTADELAQLQGVSVILAKERLLLTEKVGGVCRDETVEGLRFYSNLFLTRTD
ncbi:vacuolar protein-sorting-associated protein 36-like [Mizuhopecten yessoensis]|uniref:Vacuolar protein-sorting-associated protein 36 n=1 Tax=Mizuhopecten yessoensis TaxID=6573 RepID=A0A210QE93_MIZYE|nr:vacuolar protein-sorting-associated protein 36-like [Mizuhopecten yessoensis]OWF47056.1 Vacuolar protein-sorting-associated protein 36 [Mizuhopecten yessoensis]